MQIVHGSDRQKLINILGLDSHSEIQQKSLELHSGVKRKVECEKDRPAKKIRMNSKENMIKQSSVLSEDRKKLLRSENIKNTERFEKLGRTRTTVLQSSGKVNLFSFFRTFFINNLFIIYTEIFITGVNVDVSINPNIYEKEV